MKLIDPTGDPFPGATTLTFAVNVTDWPLTEGLADDVSVVKVPAGLTVKVPLTNVVKV